MDSVPPSSHHLVTLHPQTHNQPSSLRQALNHRDRGGEETSSHRGARKNSITDNDRESLDAPANKIVSQSRAQQDQVGRRTGSTVENEDGSGLVGVEQNLTSKKTQSHSNRRDLDDQGRTSNNTHTRPDPLSELAVPEPVDRSFQKGSLEGRFSESSDQAEWPGHSSPHGPGARTEGLSELAVPQPEQDPSESDAEPNGDVHDTEEEKVDEEESSSNNRWTQVMTEVYTISWLIFFSFLGTLARLGLEAINKYSNAPVSSPVLWANVGGTLILGFLTEDRRIFREEWGRTSTPLPRSSFFRRNHDNNDNDNSDPETESQRGRALASHTKVKKTIPLYIGLATGFCGCFTSFSTFMRDAFLSLTNDLPTPSPGYPISSPAPPHQIHRRNAGYSFEATLAILLLHSALPLASYRAGAHLAILLDPILPTLPFRLIRRFLDPLSVLLAGGCWLGSILLTVYPPYTVTTNSSPNTSPEFQRAYPWRARTTFALVLSPPGCLLRFYLSRHLNPLLPSFPLGTFTANIVGTLISGMAFDLQHLPSVIGNNSNVRSASYTSCAVLEGILEGFCGCTTTVSTWAAELSGLRRAHAWRYGLVSVVVALAGLVAVMGSVGWTKGFEDPVCL